MLDRTNYTTRTDLTPQEISALLTVRTMLENDCVTFGMNCANYCIGGHMATQLGIKILDRGRWVRENRDDTKFSHLFYPRNGDDYLTNAELCGLTREGAIIAINKFLGGDNRPWES